ncbi:MAG TPA: hypothetical protein VLV55_06520 [Rhizomicrobium sp.]|nr:hypothetical protein [Rhizomicrobium sp.]
MKIVAPVFAVLAFLAIGGGPGWATSDTQPSPSQNHAADLRNALKFVSDEAQKDHADKTKLSEIVGTVIADPVFPMLPEDERHFAYIMAGALFYDTGKFELGRSALTEAVKMPEATDLDWDLAFKTDFRLHDYVPAAQDLTVLARKWPSTLSDYNDRAIARVIDQSDEDDPTGAVPNGLLSTLEDIKWKPQDPFLISDDLWLILVRLRLEQNDLAGAKRAAVSISDPQTLIEMRADKRFDAITQADPGRFDVMKAYQSYVSDLRSQSAASPDKLEGINRLVEALLGIGRVDEALTITTEAIAKAKAKPDAFSDKDDFLNWIMDSRARALFALRRSDEGFAQLEEAAALKEHGARNVSQAINLADRYVAYDRPADAIKALEGFDTGLASEYGRMALDDARANAYFEQGDSARLADVLQDMRAHAKDGSQPFLDAMLTVGDLDAAAAEVISELRDPHKRLAMLRYLQNYVENNHRSEREEATHKAWTAVKARADVLGEVAKVGRIETYDLLPPSY